jgi:lipopolysaccharide export system permease protein
MSSLTAGELLDRLNHDPEAAVQKTAKEAAEDLSALKTEVNKRFSFSLASFAFALIGVPLAITAHRKETSVGFLLSLCVAFVYFFFIIIADTVRSNPALHPEILIWSPNIIFIALGAWRFVLLSRQ